MALIAILDEQRTDPRLEEFNSVVRGTGKCRRTAAPE
jgi:hypothetical protein